jgi:hypothetical protein
LQNSKPPCDVSLQNLTPHPCPTQFAHFVHFLWKPKPLFPMIIFRAPPPLLQLIAQYMVLCCIFVATFFYLHYGPCPCLGRFLIFLCKTKVHTFVQKSMGL